MNFRLLILLILSILVFSANIGGTSVYILDEAKNAACAMEMYQRNDRIVPTFNSELRFDKPPLHYFFMQVAFSMLGVSPLSVRIFSALMGVLLVLAVYFFGKRNMPERAAFLSSLILIASLHLAFQFHLAVPDPYLILFSVVGLFCFYEGIETNNKIWLYACYCCLAVATLAKGPVAIVLPGLTAFIFLLTQKKMNWYRIKQMRLVEGILIFALVAFPWYALVHKATAGVWTEQFFLQHNVKRFTSTMEGHGGFPLASFVLVFAALIPFSFFIPQMLRKVWNAHKRNSFLMFCLIGFLVVTGFYAFSRTILPTYIGPALPFLALLLGYYFQKVIKKNRTGKLWPSLSFYLLIAFLIPVAVYMALEIDPSLTSIKYVSAWFIVLPASGLFAAWFLYKKDVEKMFYSLVAGSIGLLLIFYYVIYPQVDARNPVNRSLELVEDVSKIQYFYGGFNPAYVFALQRPVKELHSMAEVERSLERDSSILILTQKEYLHDLDTSIASVIFEGKDLFENPVTVVLGGK